LPTDLLPIINHKANVSVNLNIHRSQGIGGEVSYTYSLRGDFMPFTRYKSLLISKKNIRAYKVHIRHPQNILEIFSE
jgi:hypothetical protein